MDSIVAHTQRSRESSRIAAESVATGTNQPISAEVGTAVTAEDFSFDDIQTPSLTVPPGTEFDVKVSFSSDGGLGDVYNPGHPDYCTVGFINRPAARLFVRVKSAGGAETSTQPECWSTDNETPVFRTLRAVSPSSGDQTVTAELVGANSLTVYDTTEVTVSVDSDTEEPPDFPDDPDNGDGDNGDGDNGNVLPELPNLIGTAEAVALGGGLTLLLVVLIATR